MITLKTLPQATAQQVFDQVAAHLLKQNRQSGDINSFSGVFDCYYKNAEGLRCAAGCLIGDDEYRATMEGASWESLMTSGTVPPAHSDLIQELQMTHDFNEPAKWGVILQQIADSHKLEFKHHGN